MSTTSTKMHVDSKEVKGFDQAIHGPSLFTVSMLKHLARRGDSNTTKVVDVTAPHYCYQQKIRMMPHQCQLPVQKKTGETQ
jgi:hypothetical protein